MRGIYTYKITLSNTTSTATPPNLQVRLNINFSAIEDLNVDLGNIRFSSDIAGNSLLYAWLESAPQGIFTVGNSISSYRNSNIWVNLGNNIIPANGLLNIYMQVLPSGTEFDGVYWGANPLWTSTYGQYDNGAYVFNNYWNFAGTSLPSGLTALLNTSNITINNGITFSGSNDALVYFGPIAYPQIIETLITTNVTETYPTVVIGEAMTNTPWGGSAWLENGYSWDYYGQSLRLEYITTSTRAGPPNGYVSETIPAGTILGMSWVAVGNEKTYYNYLNQISSTDTTISSISNYYGWLGFDTSGSTTYSAQWLRTRTYPPNGTDPVLTSIMLLFVGNYISASIPVPDWSTLKGKSYVTVSAKGISNGLSNILNDGADFGPDTPGTQTSGIQEALNSLPQKEISLPTGAGRVIYFSENPTVFLMPGLYLINATIMLPEYGGYNLRGSGILQTILQDNTTTGITVIKQALPPNVGNYYAQLNSSISDFSIIGNSSGTSIAGIDLTQPENIPHYDVHDLYIGGYFAKYHISMDGCEDSHLHDIWLDGTSNYTSIDSSVTAFANAVVVEYSTPAGVTNIDNIIASGNTSAIIATQSSNLYIRNSVIGMISTALVNTSAGSIGNVMQWSIDNIFFNPTGSTNNSILFFYSPSGQLIFGTLSITNSWGGTNGNGGIFGGYFGSTSNIPFINALYMNNNHFTGFKYLSTSNLTPSAFILTNASSISIKSVLTGNTVSNLQNIGFYSGPALPNGSSNGIVFTDGFTSTETTAGTTAGTVIQSVITALPNYHKIMYIFNAYENDTTTSQTINHMVPFSTVAVITSNTTGLSLTASLTELTITAPDNTTLYSGLVIVEGY